MSSRDKPKIYSYTRFSSAEQGMGDSERRQYEAAKRYAKAKGLMLDESLRMTDRGLSGFHGVHRKKGALGAFLQKVEDKEVPPGAILLVENIDRLGREPVSEALKTIVFGLLEHQITIETLFPPDTYTKESINSGGIWRLVAHIERAHAESKRKSDLGKANWTQKRKLARDEKRVLTGRAPAWLRPGKDGGFEVITEAAETIQMIFRLKLEGFGKGLIERKLNKEAPWSPPKNAKRKGDGWRASYIEKILKSRAVIGEFQPHRIEERNRVPDGDPIANYFPAVVDPETFHAVQQKLKGGRGTGGKTGKGTNVFRNLVKCGYCGGSMVFVNKGKPPKGGRYLVCDNGRRNAGCKAYQVRYEEFEETVLSACSKLRPETVLPNPDEEAEASRKLRIAMSGLTGELADIEKQVENFIDQIGSTGNASLRVRYEQRVEELEAKKAQIEADRAKKESQLKELEKGFKSFTAWRKNLEGLKGAIRKDAETRIRLNSHLKEFIAKVEVFAKGHESSVEHAEALIEEYLSELESSPSYPDFRRHLRRRLLSQDGRFFKLGFWTIKPDCDGVQIAPETSLAAASQTTDDSKFRGPKLDHLLSEFFDKRKPGFVAKPTVSKRLAPQPVFGAARLQR